MDEDDPVYIIIDRETRLIKKTAHGLYCIFEVRDDALKFSKSHISHAPVSVVTRRVSFDLEGKQ